LPPTMTLADGRVVNAVYGFTGVLIKALREFKPEYIVVTFDKKGPTFRHLKYKEYKANREKAPDELYAQIPMAKEIVESFNIPIFEKSGFEADDLIGTLSKKLDGTVEKIIVTGDMDTLQLVNDHTRIYTMSRGMSESVIYGPNEVLTKYSLRPDQIIDYKALRGDPSDNIPGVKGIGEKTAVELLLGFETLDGVYENIDSPKIKDRIRGLLLEHKDNAYISKELATIKCDVEIDFDLSKAVFKEFDKEDILAAFGKYEFKSLLPRVKALFDENLGASPAEAALVGADKFDRNKNDFKYKLIDSDEDFEEFYKKLNKQKIFTFDTETTGFDPLVSRLLGISFSWQEGEAYYLNFDKKIKASQASLKNETPNLFNYNNKPTTASPLKTDLHPWLERLAHIFIDSKIKKIGHNIKFDIKVLEAQGLKVEGIFFDTMLAAFLLTPENRQTNLDSVVYTELGFEKISKIDLLGKGRDKVEFSELAVEKLSLYSCEDADFTNRLYGALEKKIKSENFEKLFKEIEMPLIRVLADMEKIGIKLDSSFLKKMKEKVGANIKELERKIFKLSVKPFNIKSTQQLGVILFEDLKISIEGIKKNKKGYSTAFDELEKIKSAHPIIVFIQEYRELTKLQSTYIEALPKLALTKKPSAFIRASIKLSPLPAAFLQPTPISKIYRSAPRRAAKSGKPLFQKKIINSWHSTTLR
jgi:DNA polymerase I